MSSSQQQPQSSAQTPAQSSAQSSAPAAKARPFWLTFLLFTLPLMAANILQSLSGTINNIYLGQLVGVKALAAASIFFPIAFLFIAFLIGISAGASVLIGQAWGARNRERVKAITGTVLTVAVLGGLVIGICTAIWTENILRGLGTPEDIFENAVDYARISFLAMPLMFLFFIASSVLRGVGDTITPLLSMIVSVLLGALVTPALILGWGGLPALGVVAPAVANAVAFLTATLWLGIHLHRKRHEMAPDRALLRHLRPNGAILWQVIRLGVPTGVQVVTGAAAGLVIMRMVNGFGSDATAAYGAVNQIMSYVQFPAISIAIATSIFGAQAIGGGRVNELGRITRTGLAMNLALTGGLIAMAYLFSRPVIGLFVTEPAIVEIAQQLLHVVLWSVVLFGAASVLAGVMRSSGTVLVPMLISIAAIVLVELPVAFWLSARMGIIGIWWGFVSSFIALLAMQSAYYWFVWRKKRIVAL